jgi:hypothetical protein
MAIDCRYGVKQGPRSGFFALWHQSNNRLNTFDWPARRHRVTSKEDQVPRPSPNSDRDSPESLLDKIQSDHFEITLSPSAQNHGHVEIQGKGLLNPLSPTLSLLRSRSTALRRRMQSSGTKGLVEALICDDPATHNAGSTRSRPARCSKERDS